MQHVVIMKKFFYFNFGLLKLILLSETQQPACLAPKFDINIKNGKYILKRKGMSFVKLNQIILLRAEAMGA